MGTALPALRNFIGGSYSDPAGGVTSPVVDPCTGEQNASAPVSSARPRGSSRTRCSCSSAVPEMPHGGFGHSGYGKDLSMYGFAEYTRIKHVMSYLG